MFTLNDSQIVFDHRIVLFNAMKSESFSLIEGVVFKTISQALSGRKRLTSFLFYYH